MSEIDEALPSISKQVIGARLKEYRQLGVIHRRVEQGPPVSTWYSLTAKGIVLAGAAGTLERLANDLSLPG